MKIGYKTGIIPVNNKYCGFNEDPVINGIIKMDISNYLKINCISDYQIKIIKGYLDYWMEILSHFSSIWRLSYTKTPKKKTCDWKTHEFMGYNFTHGNLFILFRDNRASSIGTQEDLSYLRNWITLIHNLAIDWLKIGISDVTKLPKYEFYKDSKRYYLAGKEIYDRGKDLKIKRDKKGNYHFFGTCPVTGMENIELIFHHKVPHKKGVEKWGITLIHDDSNLFLVSDLGNKILHEIAVGNFDGKEHPINHNPIWLSIDRQLVFEEGLPSVFLDTYTEQKNPFLVMSRDAYGVLKNNFEKNEKLSPNFCWVDYLKVITGVDSRIMFNELPDQNFGQLSLLLIEKTLFDKLNEIELKMPMALKIIERIFNKKFNMGGICGRADVCIKTIKESGITFFAIIAIYTLKNLSSLFKAGVKFDRSAAQIFPFSIPIKGYKISSS